jgi:F-type H+-transporting ATPase subunit a
MCLNAAGKLTEMVKIMLSNMLANTTGHLYGLEGTNFDVTPAKISIFGIQISETIILTWAVMAILIIAAIIIRVFVLKKFTAVPRGIQNVLEMFVSFAENFSKSSLGEHGASYAAYVFTIAIMIVTTSLTELFGFRPPATDINFTIALAVMSFVLINFYGFYHTGFFGRIGWFFKPKAFMFPVNVVTHMVIPISLSFRLFGNMFAGMVVMDLLYSVIYLSVGIPAVLAIYFNLFHVGIQTYIFLILTLSFMEETVTYGKKR